MLIRMLLVYALVAMPASAYMAPMTTSPTSSASSVVVINAQHADSDGTDGDPASERDCDHWPVSAETEESADDACLGICVRGITLVAEASPTVTDGQNLAPSAFPARLMKPPRP